MSDSLATALLAIGERPLCSTVTVEQGDDDELAFYIQNGQNDDWASETGLTEMLAFFDQDSIPYSVTVYLAQPADDDLEPEGWQSPTIDDRNALALAHA